MNHCEQCDVCKFILHRFCQRRSHKYKLIVTIDDLSSYVDKGEQTNVMLVDIHKALDTVSQRRLFSMFVIMVFMVIFSTRSKLVLST